MKALTYVAVLLLLPGTVAASSSSYHLSSANINPNDIVSLQNGARNFANYCLNCHSLSLMRYNRVAKDLQIDEKEVERVMLFTGAKIGDNIKISMEKADAKRWFGTIPPDLSVITRARGVDWVYTYLRSFYKDPARPWGVNNALFKDVAMPHVLWELQGLQQPVYHEEPAAEGHAAQKVISGFEIIEPGKLSPEQYDEFVRDIANFLHYVGEPAKPVRLALGKWVILYLAIFFIVVYLLKKEYWKDIAK